MLGVADRSVLAGSVLLYTELSASGVVVLERNGPVEKAELLLNASAELDETGTDVVAPGADAHWLWFEVVTEGVYEFVPEMEEDPGVVCGVEEELGEVVEEVPGVDAEVSMQGM